MKYLLNKLKNGSKKCFIYNSRNYLNYIIFSFFVNCIFNKFYLFLISVIIKLFIFEFELFLTVIKVGV